MLQAKVCFACLDSMAVLAEWAGALLVFLPSVFDFVLAA